MPIVESNSFTTLSSTDSKPPIAISDTLVAVNISEALGSSNLDRLRSVLKDMNCTLDSYTSPFGNLLHIAASFSSVALLKQIISESPLNINSQTQQGSTPLHIAARQNRPDVVEFLMGLDGIDDTIRDLEGRTPLECSKSRQVKNIIEYMRSVHVAKVCKQMHNFVQKEDLEGFKSLFSGKSKRNLHLIDVNMPNPRGESILHEAVKTGNFDLVQACLNLGADPFQKNRKGKIPVELTRKDAIKEILKAAPMIKSKQVLNSKNERVEGFLHKWTNYAGGYRRRWFVLEDSVLSYFSRQEEYPATCRGSINLEFFKIVPHRSELCKFELHGTRNANIKYFLKADNQEDAKRWIFSLAQSQTIGHTALLQESRSLPNLLQIIHESKDSVDSTPETSKLPQAVSVDHLFAELLKQEVEISAFFDMLIDLNHEDSANKISLGMITDAHSLFLKSIRSVREQLLRLEASLAHKDRRLAALKNEKQILEDAVRALAVENNRMQERLMNSLSEDGSQESESISEAPEAEPFPSTVTSTFDSEDEFFDAYEGSIVLEQMSELRLKSHAQPTSGHIFAPSHYGYCTQPRQALPADSTTMPSISLWNILKNAIQQPDLTKMPIPINFSEPISMLQRMCEDLEYVELLSKASQESDPARKLLYISAFATSSYSSTDGRVSKPFNPLLGETFEFVHPDGKFRYLSEQVSHHPPIGASYCEGPGFVYWNEVHVSSRFRGKYLELKPEGLTHLRMGDAHYSWNRVNTAVNNIIVGKLYLEHYGTMKIQEHGSDLCAEIEFMTSGWRKSTGNRIQGTVKNVKTGEIKYKISGHWNKTILAQECDSEESFPLWIRKEAPSGSAQSYNMTAFAMTLNELPTTLLHTLCPSDSRLRPDQRAMEEGRFTEASALKVKLEEKQRKARKLMESGPDFVYEPRWFRHSLEPDSQAPHWAYVGGYWESRSLKKWENVPQIYL